MSNDSTIDLLLNRMFRERDEAQAEIARLRGLLKEQKPDAKPVCREGKIIDIVTIAFQNGSLSVYQIARLLRRTQEEAQGMVTARIESARKFCENRIQEEGWAGR